MLIKDNTINSLYRLYTEACNIADCFVDVTGISSETGKDNFPLTTCIETTTTLLRVSGFCVAATNPKDIETALEVLFGKTLTPKNIANQVKFNEFKKIGITCLNPAFDPVSKRVVEYQLPKRVKSLGTVPGN